MTGEKDHYFVLGIPRTAGDQVVRNAFRVLARQYRPQWGGQRKGRGFRDILEAYEVLSDPLERAAYDGVSPGPRKVQGQKSAHLCCGAGQGRSH